MRQHTSSSESSSELLSLDAVLPFTVTEGTFFAAEVGKVAFRGGSYTSIYSFSGIIKHQK